MALNPINKNEFRSDDGNFTIKPDDGILEGYPIVFNQRTAIGNYFYEEIDAHALDEADLSDVLLLLNHNDSMMPLARHRRGKRSSMEISINEHGLHIIANVDKNANDDAKKACSAISRGDVDDMSFAFNVDVEGDEWSALDTQMPIRKITKIRKVFEVSIVNRGAYPQTTISARSVPLENAKKALEKARAEMLENRKVAEEKGKAFALKKRKFLYREEMKKYE